MEHLIDKTELANDYLTIPQTIKTLQISQNTLYRYFSKGVFQPIKFKNKNYIRSRDIKDYLFNVFGESV
jgi:predicted DNA-binding transcriptional regulator AlpA